MHRLAFLLAVLVAPGLAAAGPKAVVELFTSEGCSSCVAADAYFEELVERDDVLALSLHVDYWDYLGWPDTLGDPANTERQRAYAEVHDTRRIYTPQIIVNGAAQFVGSHRKEIEAAIKRAALPVPVDMRRHDEKVIIEVAARPLPRPWPTTIRLVLFSSEVEVDIAGGENAGATLDYYNVVRAMRPIGMWDGLAVRIALPGDELMGDGIDGCAVIVQEDLPEGPGRILGAAQLGAW
jgi:hypothetical protein